MIKPKVSIIGTVFNHKKSARRVLESWCCQNFHLPYEILVMDDGSNDGCEQMVNELAKKYPNKLRYFYLHRPWVTCYVHPMNLGIKQSKADIVVLALGLDRIPESNALRKLYEPHDTNDKAVTALQIRHIGSSHSGHLLPEEFVDELMNSIDWLNNTDLLYDIAGREDPSFLATMNEGASVCIRKKWLCDIGGFDERYLETWNYANLDLWSRIKRYGLEINIVQSACFHQPHPIAGFTYDERREPLDMETLRKTYKTMEAGYNVCAGRLFENIKSQMHIDDGSIIRNKDIEWGTLPYQKEINYIDSLDTVLNQSVDEKLSIIMLSWNRRHLTRTAIECFIKFTDMPFELIIVDNGSSDGTVEMIKEYAKRYDTIVPVLNDSNESFCKGLNQGFEYVTGDYVLYTQNDVFVGKDWAQHAINLYKYLPNCGALGMDGGNFVAGNKLLGTFWNGDLVNGFDKQNDFIYQNMGYLNGFFILCAKQFLSEFGIRWDENYKLFWEDCDFCRQVTNTNKLCYMVNRTLISYYHLSNATITYNLDDEYRQENVEKGKKYFIQKWGKW